MSTKVASLHAEIGAKTEAFERGAKKVKDELKSIAPGLEKSAKGLTNFVSSNAALIGVLGGVAVALGQTVREHVAYANAVRQQAQVSGTSTEAASRYLQVLDDYKISSQEALQAARALTNAGHVPSIETLATLSDQYLSLNSEQEKNEFILKNLGRGGLQWVEVLGKGSKALREQGDAVADNLVLSQKMVDDARKAEIALDNWNDSIQGVKTSLAAGLLPALTGVTNRFMVGLRAAELFYGSMLDNEKGVTGYFEALEQAKNEQEAQTAAMVEMRQAAEGGAESFDDLTKSEEANEEVARRLSDTYSGLLSSMFDIQRQNDDYAETLAGLSSESEDLIAEKNRLIMKMTEEKEAGKLTNDEYMRYVENLAEITNAQEENAKAIVDAGAEQKKAGEQRVYDLVQQKLAADGVVSSGEYEYLQNLAVSYDLVSRAAADQAISENKRADALISSFEQTLPPMERTLATMQAIAGYNGQVVNFGVNFQSNTPRTPLTPGGYYNAQAAPGGYGYQNMKKRDHGGAGIAGEPYMIGTGAQPEVFVPDTNGTFVPNANKGGTTIIINNPKREAAENSIRTALKKLSYVGVAV